MADKTRTIGWGEYQHLCKLLARKVHEVFDPEVVVGIAHGGVIVGATIATILGRDFFPIKFSRRVNASVVRKHSKLLVPPTAHLEGRRVLLVDDATVSGETMKSAASSIRKHGPARVVSAVLVRRGSFEADYSASYFAGKVVFPWQMTDEDSQESLEQLHQKERRK